MGNDAPLPARKVTEIIRAEWPRVIAQLVGDLGSLAAAEDAAQDAIEQALRVWTDDTIPDRPGAWLAVVARRRAIDTLRREARGREKAALSARLSRFDTDEATALAEPDPDASLLRDEQLQLLFACCHPALKPEAQMALTLRSLGGLTTTEIAAAFLVPEPTMAQRLVRAKRKIATAGIPFKIPPDAELLERTQMVRTVIYLIFNEGYDRSSGDELTGSPLCEEAIRLGRLLAELTPDDPESAGLLALMLLIYARSDARADERGDLVLLADQDRTRWDTDLIAEGVESLDRALRLRQPGPLQIQAAINALHNEASTAEKTDWRQIALLYKRLVEMDPTPIVRLNRAVAVAMVDLDDGLRLLDDPELTVELANYSHFHAARGLLLADSAPRNAAASLRTAIDLARNEPERRFLTRRLDQIA